MNRPYLQKGVGFCFCCSGGRVARSRMLPAAGTAASTGETSLQLIAAVSSWSCAWSTAARYEPLSEMTVL